MIDTNVFVSSAMSPSGSPARVFALVEQQAVDLILTDQLIDELIRALNYPRVQKQTGWTSERVQRVVRALTSIAVVAEPVERIAASRDPDDNAVLEAAVAGGADYIVTGDRDLLDLVEYRGIAIVTPAVFLSVAGG